MSYQPYPEYKTCDASWLSSLPVHWKIMQLKRSVDNCTNGIWGTEAQKEGTDTIVLRVADFNRSQLTLKDQGFTQRYIEEKDKPSRLLKPGDLLIEKSGGGEKTLVGQVVLFDKEFEAVTSNFVAKMTPLVGHDSRYLNYVFSRFYASRINYCSIKQNTGIQNLDSDAYLCERFGFPPFEEQTQIANFLDRETAKIDTLIEKQQQLIKLLQEKRQAVISHAVRVRDGDFCSKLSHYIELVSGFAFPSSEFSHNREDLRLLRGANVGVGSLKWNDNVYWNPSDAAQFKDYQLQVGDIVFGMDRPWISAGARVAKVMEKDLPSLLVQRVARLRASNGLSQDYLYLLLSSNEFRSYVEADLTGVSVPHISPDQIAGFTFRVMSKEEQEVICKEVSNSLNRLDETISASEELIRLSLERRTSLISAAVTGKIDVRNAA